jgi:pilus assembly protein CpaF
VITDEDTRELQVVQPNHVALETVEAVDDDMMAVQYHHLVKANLRQNPDWIVVGEVRAEEALFLLRAMSTGHCAMGTVHANDAVDGLDQVHLLSALTPGVQLSWFGLAKLVGKAVDIVICMKRYDEDGTVKVQEIMEVLKPGVEVVNEMETRYRTRSLVRYVPSKVIVEDGEERLLGDWIFPEPPSERLVERFRNLDVEFPWSMFGMEETG